MYILLLFGKLVTFRTITQHTYGPCALAADSLGRSVGHKSHKTISAAPACGSHKTQVSVWKCLLLLRILTRPKIRKQSCFISTFINIGIIKIFHKLLNYCVIIRHYSKREFKLKFYYYFTTWRHLFLLAYHVIPGKLDPLVGVDTRYTQELNTLHAVTCCFCVVITAHTQLFITKRGEKILFF